MESAQPNASIQGNDGLDRPVSDALLKALYHERLLAPTAFFRAREILFPQRDWQTWIPRVLLIIGAVLVLAGIVFFLAFNWAAMPAFYKFGLIEISVIGCVLGAWKCKLDSLAGKAFSVAAAILVGVFLAVFGQVYPTGAEAYNLFGAWALLISVWVIVSRARAMWLLWIMLWNITLVTYWDSSHAWMRWDEVAVALSLAGLNAGFLVLAECSERFGWRWVRAGWLRGILVLAIFGALLLPIISIIFSWRMSWTIESLLLSAAALAATYYYYRFKTPDLFALATVMLFVCILLSSFIFRFLTRGFSSHVPEAFPVLFAGILIVGIFATAAFVLRSISRDMPSKPEAPEGAERTESSKENTPEGSEPMAMRALLERLQSESLLNSAERDALNAALFKSKDEKPTPWYLHALVAIGAWLASLCFFGFVLLILSGVIDKPDSAMTLGVFWVGIAVFMSRTWEAIFFSQLALAMSAAGHFLILYGIGWNSIQSEWYRAAVAAGLCVVLNPLYRTATHRFLSAALALFWISYPVTYGHSGMSFDECLLVCIEGLIAGVMFTRSNLPANLRPPAFALAVALPVSFHIFMFDHSPFRHWYSVEYSWWVLNAVMAVLMGILIARLTAGNARLRAMQLWIVFCITILGLFGGAGLLLGLGLMVLGYARRERELVALGTATLVSFMFSYYYNLETDLLSKSMILGGSGVALLLIRALLVRRAATEATA